VPESVKQWINFADLKDFVALDPTLSDDYAPNSSGVNPVDVVVNNNYQWEGLLNPHSVFGYLQSGECAFHVYNFILGRRSNMSAACNFVRQSVRDNILQEETRRRKRSAPRHERPTQKADSENVSNQGE
jgi:hypothetical protein